MPSIDLNFLLLLQGNYTNYENFIETGTNYGATIYKMENLFKNLYTIEIKKELYDRLNKNNKIHFLLGDSSIELKKLLPNINGKSIIFLDGHWSSGNTGKGNKDCPLYEELENIKLYHKNEAIIIIDDTPLFGKGPNKDKSEFLPENWEDISQEGIIKKMNERIIKTYYLKSGSWNNMEDRLIIHISSIL
jgi:hypothetical protein